MNSDWHIGSGNSRGEMDRTVQRDPDDLPYIPAKTLTGILRDSCEQVAEALDQGDSQRKWQNWVDFLFGNQPTLANAEEAEIEPNPALIRIHSAFLEESLRQALKAKPQLKSAIALMKPGVKISPDTGSAMPDHLRIEELIRSGAVLTSQQCGFNYDDAIKLTPEEQKTAYALLLAGATLVERIGGKRRRGSGNCTITIDPKSRGWLEWFQLQYQGNTLPDPPQWGKAELSTANQPSPKPKTSENWWTIPLTINARSPLVLPKRTVGNIVECLDLIPGRYFLRYLHKKLDSLIDVKSAIAHGNLIITNATISIDGQPSRPTPLCLFSDKLSGGLSQGEGVYNRFQEAEPEGIQLKGERSGYLGAFNPAKNQLPKHQTLKLELYTHNTIDDSVQRPSEEMGGGVYSYQAIPPNTTLQAELRIPHDIKTDLDSSSPNWWQNLKGYTRIGQSKKDQYGGIEIQPQPPQQCQSNIQPSSELYVWLLSDVVLRDERLKPTTDPDDLKQLLENELGISLECCERKTPQGKELLSLMARSRRTESWQVRWGLPRPSMLGLQAGSCFVYKIIGNQQPAPEKLAELEAKGIGERRVEGYGQICFNDPLLTSQLNNKIQPTSKGKPSDPTLNRIKYGDLSFDYARTIETAAWRDAIEKKSLAIAASRENRQEILGIKIDGEESQPSMSQLGGLRSTLRRLQSLPDQNQITSWITAIENVRNRKEKWDQTDNGLQKIRELVTNDQKIWQALNIVSLDQLTITVGGRNELKQILWAEAVRTLVDAMIRAHKRDLEKVQGKQSHGTQDTHPLEN
ncbi:MAG: hypothetical protein GVY17_02560 [Cyanobacteria bacterium]|nr:hypothetical protein [Cyanobacteria bacterium GSL.Bin21]